MSNKENKVYDFFKKDQIKEKTVIFLLSAIIIVLLLYIVGMRFSFNIENSSDFPLTENSTKEVNEINSDVKTEDLLININSDNIFELCKLPGIGETRAKAILEYRKENGNFSSPEELLNVHGIGENTYNSLKDYICLE